MTERPWWASESMWRKTAIFVTAGMFVVLIGLTLDSLRAISVGSERVPAYSVINYRLSYEWDAGRGMFVPRIAHRLDRETSGLVLCAQSRSAERGLKRLPYPD